VTKYFINITFILTILLFLHGTTIAQTSTATGYASWYHPNLQGRATASGEIYDRTKYTAAHRTLPFGSLVRVTNLSNGKSVTVRINDRGPSIQGRLIDISEAAARDIDMIDQGVVQVRLDVISMGSGTESSSTPHLDHSNPDSYNLRWINGNRQPSSANVNPNEYSYPTPDVPQPQADDAPPVLPEPRMYAENYPYPTQPTTQPQPLPQQRPVVTYKVQFGAFQELPYARQMRDKLLGKGIQVGIYKAQMEDGRYLYKVLTKRDFSNNEIGQQAVREYNSKDIPAFLLKVRY